MKVFITRHIAQDSPLRLLSNKIELSGHSLLKIEPISFEKVPPSDWIFFYSSNGVRYFVEGFQQWKEYFKTVKVGVMGSGTASVFEKMTNFSPDFINNGDKQTAVEFFGKSSESILFVKGSNSLESVERYIEPERVNELIVYDNQADHTISIPDADIYILTSPMNAEVYMNKACCRFNTKIIAIGQTTNNKLIEKGFLLASFPDTPSEEAIVLMLKEMVK